MSGVRLIVLGLLAHGEPMHGHLIRRFAADAQVAEWGGVAVGSLYAALHRLELEGLVEVVRSERDGRRPTRSVYAITAAGRLALADLRSAALSESGLGAMEIDLAIAFGREPDPVRLRAAFARRRGSLEQALARLVARRDRSQPEGLAATTIAALRHGEHRIAAELTWMDELDVDALAAVAAGRESRGLRPGP